MIKNRGVSSLRLLSQGFYLQFLKHRKKLGLIDNQYFTMSNPPQEQIKDVYNAQEAASRKFEQIFEFANRTVTHAHHLQVELLQQKSQKIEILNHFASVKDQKITKLTEIHFQNRIIKIVDTFSYDNKQWALNNSNKIQTFQGSIRQTNYRQNLLRKRYKTSKKISEGEEVRHRDTKNVVKNIIRLFQSWIETHPHSRSQIEESLSGLVSRNKYNNSLILDISKDQLLRKSFIAFTEGSGEQCVNRSKINDKESHLQALRRYLRICWDQQYRSPASRLMKVEQQQQQIKQQQVM